MLVHNEFFATPIAYGFSLSPPLEDGYKLSDFDAGMFPRFECFQINFRWQKGPLRVSESETQLESIGIKPSEVPCSSKKYVTGRELLFGSKIHTAGSRIKKALWEMSANVNHYF